MTGSPAGAHGPSFVRVLPTILRPPGRSEASGYRTVARSGSRRLATGPRSAPTRRMERDCGSVTVAFHGCRSAVGRLRAGGRLAFVQMAARPSIWRFVIRRLLTRSQRQSMNWVCSYRRSCGALRRDGRRPRPIPARVRPPADGPVAGHQGGGEHRRCGLHGDAASRVRRPRAQRRPVATASPRRRSRRHVYRRCGQPVRSGRRTSSKCP
jgi:hypothetical protein